MGEATLIKVDGTKMALGHRPTLREAQRLVGGYIELLRLKGLTLVVDEDGWPKGKEVNHTASELFAPLGVELVGDVIVLKGWRTFGKR